MSLERTRYQIHLTSIFFADFFSRLMQMKISQETPIILRMQPPFTQILENHIQGTMAMQNLRSS